MISCESLIMSMPRLAIHRPVTMFMISCIVILLGLISLTRLPVDPLPGVSQPTINVNVSDPGDGTLEREELGTRPLEGALSATSGVEQITSQSSEGRSQVRLNFA